ncbi:hypothetical protein [Kitasatospora purpeofusca]|uniref:hypothetical protein n=1 Tax=Kitasatospora purpeofusca TaxID=67352 RepID=UPI00225A3157|nr:hypothetical protein [Kitasatospora purpeofusca]MCX4752878.1 hypothetical protein [Kitasatospora purpeofusca]WSR32422.1 hypothetical protein OG715_16400 [Kitasatospora purpeofusca]
MSVPWWEAPHPDPDVEPAGQWNGPHLPGWVSALAGIEKMLARRGRKNRRRAATEEPRR